jgi:hypothetical protein
MDDVEKRKSLTLPGLEIPPFCCPALSLSLFRLQYPVGTTDAEIVFEVCHSQCLVSEAAIQRRVPSVEAGSNTSTIALQVVKGEEKESQCLVA